MLLTQPLEQTDAGPALRRAAAFHKRAQLEVVADQDEGFGEPQRPEARRLCHLARLVHEAVVEARGRDRGRVYGQAGCAEYLGFDCFLFR